MSAIFAARHAKVAASGVCYGRADVPLAGSHDDAAAALAASYPGPLPARVWSSRSPRCRGTAERLAARLGAPLAIDDALAELSFGAVWEGRTWGEIAARDPAAWERWCARWEHEGPPGGESARALEARVGVWRARLSPRETHVVVAHAGVVRALMVLAGGLVWPAAMGAEIDHLGWNRFPLGGGDVDNEQR